ncbi:MAG: 2-oxoacid:acceptor oxidoreductase family protein [Candidatus Hodarchaeota archaeon]
MTRTEIRIVASGGQGAITMGNLLGRIATLYEGKYAAQTHSYGAAVRGGVIWTEVVISDYEIDYPGVIDTDVFIIMSQSAADRYVRDIKRGDMVIIDSSLVQNPPIEDLVLYQIPASELAEEKFGNSLFANMILLGFLVGLTEAVRRNNFIKAAKEWMKLSSENIKAFDIGFSIASQEGDSGRGD